MNDLLIWFYRYIYKLLAAELLLSRNLFDLRLSQHFCLVLCTFVIQLHHYTHKICPYCKSLCVSLWLIHIMNSQCLTRWHWELNAVLFVSFIYIHCTIFRIRFIQMYVAANFVHSSAQTSRKSTEEKLCYIFMFILTLVLQSEFVEGFRLTVLHKWQPPLVLVVSSLLLLQSTSITWSRTINGKTLPEVLFQWTCTVTF